MKNHLFSIVFLCLCATVSYGQTFTFSPNNGQQGTTFGVTITSSSSIPGFVSGSTTCVRLSTNPSPIFLTDINVVSPTVLTGNISIPANTIPNTNNAQIYFGPGCNNGSLCFNCFTVTASPTIVSVSPNSGQQNESQTGVTITGVNTNFTGNTDCVEILASPATITGTNVNVSSTTSLDTDITIPSNTNPGTYDVQVYEGPGCSGDVYTCSGCYTVTPTQLTISPNMGDQGASFGVTITGNGTNFIASTTTCVQILATPTIINLTGVNVSSSTELAGNVNVPLNTTVGTYDVIVYQGSGCSGTSYECYDCFEVKPAPPFITSVSPNNGNQGEFQTGVNFNGFNTNFTGNTDCVEILASPTTITGTNVNVNSTTNLEADIAIPPNTTPGTYDVRIYEGPGCSGDSYICNNCYTVHDAFMTISPNEGNQGSNFGVTVTAPVANFSSSTTCVQILASPTTISLTGISVSSSSTLTGIVNIPASHTTGIYDVIVYEGPDCSGDSHSCNDCFSISPIVPVELLRFEGERQGRNIHLSWATATESNSAYFSIERSVNGQAWRSIGQVKSAGNSQSVIEYQFIDQQPLNGINYYRLHQVDIDGTEDYSETVAIEFRQDRKAIQVFPNPAETTINVSFFSQRNQYVDVEIIDITGKMVLYQNKQSLSQGNNILKTPIDKLNAGIYFIKVIEGNGSFEAEQFIKL